MHNHRFTPLAILTTFALLIPGLVVGGIGAWMYRGFLLPLVEDNLLDWITAGWLKTLTLAILPNFIHGAIAGALAIYVNARIVKRANYEIVAYSVSSIVVVMGILSFLVVFGKFGVSMGHVEIAANVVGTITALFSMLPAIKETQLQSYPPVEVGSPQQ